MLALLLFTFVFIYSSIVLLKNIIESNKILNFKKIKKLEKSDIEDVNSFLNELGKEELSTEIYYIVNYVEENMTKSDVEKYYFWFRKNTQDIIKDIAKKDYLICLNIDNIPYEIFIYYSFLNKENKNKANNRKNKIKNIFSEN